MGGGEVGVGDESKGGEKMMKEELTLPAEIFRSERRRVSPWPCGCRYSSVTRWRAERRDSVAFPTQNPLLGEGKERGWGATRQPATMFDQTELPACRRTLLTHAHLII